MEVVEGYIRASWITVFILSWSILMANPPSDGSGQGGVSIYILKAIARIQERKPDPAPDGGIAGVASRSQDKPLKQDNFTAGLQNFTGSDHYSD